MLQCRDSLSTTQISRHQHRLTVEEEGKNRKNAALIHGAEFCCGLSNSVFRRIEARRNQLHWFFHSVLNSEIGGYKMFLAAYAEDAAEGLRRKRLSLLPTGSLDRGGGA